ncbi:hypothetical protein GBF38_002550 [Nibea albiflora]|uniref:Uncharacterized protein n=1 Tax=Nibea albiflora TaxID=240163 RepID=A0ACB7EFB0_NIBAL|nr:hypothetical protein GBF38_002550 [Nibea albiflora]
MQQVAPLARPAHSSVGPGHTISFPPLLFAPQLLVGVRSVPCTERPCWAEQTVTDKEQQEEQVGGVCHLRYESFPMHSEVNCCQLQLLLAQFVSRAV